MTKYQVVGECAHATVNNALHGRIQELLLKGALVPEDAPELKHLLSVGLVAKVDDAETGGLNADGVPAGALTSETPVPAGVTSTPVVTEEQQRNAEKAKADADLEEKRSAARSKLPADGGEPDGRAAQSVWVEYLVSKGSRYEDVHSVEKSELQKLAKQQQS